MARMTLRENWNRTKEMGLALFRQGVHELGAAFYGPGTAAQVPEYGMPYTKMASEVAADQRDKGADQGKNDSRSILDERLAKAEQARDDRGHEPPQMERD